MSIDEKQLPTLQDDSQLVPGFGSKQSLELALRAANILAKSTLVPKEYQGSAGLPNCVIALNMASRMEADPLMVMQNLYIVHGRPGWSSQFLISTFNTAGKFTALRYEWIGEKNTDTWGCRAWAIEKISGEKLEGSSVTIALAKKEGWYDKAGSKWKTMPEQMLMYRAASWFIRAYAPELAMGMHTADEIRDSDIGYQGDYIDVTPGNAPEATPGGSLMEEFSAQKTGETEPPATTELFGGDTNATTE